MKLVSSRKNIPGSLLRLCSIKLSLISLVQVLVNVFICLACSSFCILCYDLVIQGSSSLFLTIQLMLQNGYLNVHNHNLNLYFFIFFGGGADCDETADTKHNVECSFIFINLGFTLLRVMLSLLEKR